MVAGFFLSFDDQIGFDWALARPLLLLCAIACGSGASEA
jgi:hypothetical protein